MQALTNPLTRKLSQAEHCAWQGGPFWTVFDLFEPGALLSR